MQQPSFPAGVAARPIGRVHWIGLAALAGSEARKIYAWWPESVGAPLVTTILYFVIFTLAFGFGEGPGAAAGAPVPASPAVTLAQFLAPGLIALAMAQAAFDTCAVSILMNKLEGTLSDVLMPPLAPMELTLGWLAGGWTHGLSIAVLTGALLLPLAGLALAEPLWLIGFILTGAAMMAAGGLLAGLWAQKWDHLGGILTFAVSPLLFFSGVFFGPERLPAGWDWLLFANPLFYLTAGIRFGFLGAGPVAPALALAVLLGVTLLLFLITARAIRRGWRIKA